MLWIARLWRRAVNVFLSRLAYVVYWLASQLPFLSLIFFHDQWGKNVQSLYFFFQREHYWSQRLKTNRGDPEIQQVGFQLLELFLSRLDFMLRYLLSFVYGSHWVPVHPGPAHPNTHAPGAEPVPSTLPQAYSSVAYCNANDGQTAVEEGPRDNRAPGFALAADSFARRELEAIAGPAGNDAAASLYPPLYLMAEVSWLVYEEARTCHHILTDPQYGWVLGTEPTGVPKRGDPVAVVEFAGVEYVNDGIRQEQPVAAQFLLLVRGNAVILAFRGTQPISFVDWLHNLTLSDRNGSAYATLAPAGMQARKVRLHYGFASTLGLELGWRPDLNDHRSITPQACSCFCYAPDGFGSLLPIPRPGSLRMPKVIQLPTNTNAIFHPRTAPRIGTPYALISFLVKQQLDLNPKAQLYVTGHRCG